MHTCDLAGLITCAPPDARVFISDWMADQIRQRAAEGDEEAAVYAQRLERVEES